MNKWINTTALQCVLVMCIYIMPATLLALDFSEEITSTACKTHYKLGSIYFTLDLGHSRTNGPRTGTLRLHYRKPEPKITKREGIDANFLASDIEVKYTDKILDSITTDFSHVALTDNKDGNGYTISYFFVTDAETGAHGEIPYKTVNITNPGNDINKVRFIETMDDDADGDNLEIKIIQYDYESEIDKWTLRINIDLETGLSEKIHTTQWWRIEDSVRGNTQDRKLRKELDPTGKTVLRSEEFIYENYKKMGTRLVRQIDNEYEHYADRDERKLGWYETSKEGFGSYEEKKKYIIYNNNDWVYYAYKKTGGEYAEVTPAPGGEPLDPDRVFETEEEFLKWALTNSMERDGYMHADIDRDGKEDTIYRSMNYDAFNKEVYCRLFLTKDHYMFGYRLDEEWHIKLDPQDLDNFISKEKTIAFIQAVYDDQKHFGFNGVEVRRTWDVKSVDREGKKSAHAYKIILTINPDGFMHINHYGEEASELPGTIKDTVITGYDQTFLDIKEGKATSEDYNEPHINFGNKRVTYRETQSVHKHIVAEVEYIKESNSDWSMTHAKQLTGFEDDPFHRATKELIYYDKDAFDGEKLFAGQPTETIVIEHKHRPSH
ncbi:hypothetical protein JD969_15035 [Planctomycetota bacterium]|nr:hypothetical protein JD969_15035 [Planctomycetota bacterium]